MSSRGATVEAAPSNGIAKVPQRKLVGEDVIADTDPENDLIDREMKIDALGAPQWAIREGDALLTCYSLPQDPPLLR